MALRSVTEPAAALDVGRAIGAIGPAAHGPAKALLHRTTTMLIALIRSLDGSTGAGDADL